MTTSLASLKQQTIDSFEEFVGGGSHPRWPLEVFLEVSNVCNLKCAMCGPFSALNPDRLHELSAQRRGFFDFEGTARSLEPVLSHALLVHAFGYGEPTVHPDFANVLRGISSSGAMIDFITNGTRLTPAICDVIVSSGVAGVAVSMSGATRDDYENVYLGGRFEAVLDGLRRLADARASAGSRYPRITVNSIAFRHHVQSLPAFVDLMADHGVDVVEVKKLMGDVGAMAGHAAPYRAEVEGELVAQARARAYRRGIVFSADQYEHETREEPPAPLVALASIQAHARSLVPSKAPGAEHPGVDALRSPGPIAQVLGLTPLTVEHFGTDGPFYCLEPFKTMYVRRGGLVKPCCFAQDDAPALGNAAEDGAEDIWRGPAFAAIREGIEGGRYPKPACEACIRRGTGPKVNTIRRHIRDYVEWAAETRGMKLVAGTEPDPPAPAIVGPTAAYRRRRELRDALRSNPFLSAPGAPGSTFAAVIVPVYNAPDDLVSCLISVARHTRRPFELLVTDDGSTDPEVDRVLGTVSGAAPGAVVLRRAENRGFVRTVNEGLARCAAENVVILNSDTIVTDRWLDKLLAAAASRPDVATVTPLTNNGTICSVPVVDVPNEIPAGYDIDSFAALVERTSLRVFPPAPTGVGFCMLMTRRALARIGALDADAFGHGYGEENDLCRRAIAAGFVNLIADDTFVYHRGGASFGKLGESLIPKNLEIIHARYPDYAPDVAHFLEDHPLRELHRDLRQELERGPGRSTPDRVRVLHLLHHGGGTEKHVRDLAATEDRRIVSYVLTSDGHRFVVDEQLAGRRRRRWEFPLARPLGPYGPLRDAGYRKALATVCRALRIDVIHVHHLMQNTPEVAEIAAEEGMEYVLTLHDYHLLCPSYTLLSPGGEPCGACIAPAPGRSPDACMARVGQTAPYIHHYQRETLEFMLGARRLFTPSERAREVFAIRFPELAPRIEVVPHGLRRARTAGPRAAFDGRPPLNVAVAGAIEPHKGALVLRDLLDANRNDEIVFHLYGSACLAELVAEPGRERRVGRSRFVYHGVYEADGLAALLARDRIHVGLQLAVWEETFSFILSELVAAGIPVIAGDLGAQGERIRRHRLGWTVPDPRSTAAVLAVLETILEDASVLRDVARRMQLDAALPPLEGTWELYGDVYLELGKTRREHMSRAPDGDEAPFSRSYVAYLTAAATERQDTERRLHEALQAAANEREAHRAAQQHLEATSAAQARAEAERDALARERDALAHERDSLRELLRSPRHVIATSMAGLLQKTPLVWPLVSRTTQAVLRRSGRRPQRP